MSRSGLEAQTTNDLLVQANLAVQAAAARAQSDPSRPIFHIAAPSQWMNDPNGPIYFHGFYHLFYQLHPFSDQDGPKFWGHVRSRDLVKWTPLPIALAPSTDRGESGVWSGCCTLNNAGQPMIFYTSVAAGQSPQTHAEQWAAIGDQDLIAWRKLPSNPVLSETLHGDKKIYDWRDPFVVRNRNRTFLVTGGNLNQARGGHAVVNIYEAQSPALTNWTYRGVLFEIPDAEARTAECPNFFKLRDKWILFVSPYGKVQYYVGDFDAQTCRFQFGARGILDDGPGFYAPNTMQLPGGERMVWGWVNGFAPGHGWNGCLSLPRLLSVSKDGQLHQSPAPQLRKLRGERTAWRNIELTGAGRTIELPGTNTIEIHAEISLPVSGGFTVSFQGASTKSASLVMSFDDSHFRIADVEGRMPKLDGDRRLDLRLFIDRSVLELFINDTKCVTKVIPTLPADARLHLGFTGSSPHVHTIEVWPIHSIW